MATFTIVSLKVPSIWTITIVKLNIVPCSTHTLTLPSLHKSFIPFDGITYMPIFPCVNPSHDQRWNRQSFVLFFAGAEKRTLTWWTIWGFHFIHPSIHPSITPLFPMNPRVVWQYLVILWKMKTFNSQINLSFSILLLNNLM